MSTLQQQKTSRPALQAAVPQRAVKDLSEALAYFQKVLGFSLAWQWGEPPHMASVCRDTVEVNLCWSAMTRSATPAPP